MLLDRSTSMRRNFELVEKAAEQFVAVMLPDDKARIGSFSDRIQVDPREFTSDHDELVKILRTELQVEGPTPLWNAVNVGITALLHEQGRRVVLVFTDGDGRADEPQQQQQQPERRDEAGRGRERHGVRHRPRRLDSPPGHRSGGGSGAAWRRWAWRPRRLAVVVAAAVAGEAAGVRAALAAAARSSVRQTGRGPAEDRGGHRRRLLRADVSTDDLAKTFTRVADELHHQYALGFTPTTLDGKMHTLTLRVTEPAGLTARARKSYLATTPRS